MVFISSARNITGGLICILQTFCSTNFLPVFLRHNKLTILSIFNKKSGEITFNFSYQNSRYFWHAPSAHLHRQVATSTFHRKCQHKNGVKSKNDKRGEKKREQQWKRIFWLFSYSTKHTRNPLL